MNNIRKITQILLLFSFLISIQAQDHWEITGNMPNPVADAEIVFYQTGMYLLGGYSEVTQSTVNYIQRYDFSANSWSESSSMLVPRRGFVSVAYSREIFCAGGVTSQSENTNSLEVWDFFNTKIIIANSEYFNRNYASGVIYGGKLFIIGGNPGKILTGTNYPYIVRYDLSVNVSSIVENQTYINRRLPEQQMVEIIQDNIYIFGGVLNGVSQDIFKYNINSKMLTKLNIQLLEPRAAGQAILFGDDNLIFIIGGYNESHKALASVEVFSIEGDTYRIWSGPELNVSRTNCMASYHLNTIYVMGGFDINGKVLSSIETLAPVVSHNEKGNSLPLTVELHQNYPNPFNPSTKITFSLSQGENIALDIYSTNGELIKTLAYGEYAVGRHDVIWNSTDNNGKQVTSGVYIYSIKGSNFNISKKMILIR